MRTRLLILLFALVAGAASAQWCYNLTTGQCSPLYPELGITTCPTGWANSNEPCPTSTPGPSPTPTRTVTPTPRATLTPTVTPVQASYTITQFLNSRDLGYSYVMAMTMLDSAVFLTGGVCCPGIPPGQSSSLIGECVAVIDYAVSPPLFREWVCSYRDSAQLWEAVAAQVARSDRWKWVAAGESTFRPATGALQTSAQASNVWGFGVQTLTDPWFTWTANIGRLLYPEYAKNWPLAILDLDGMRWLYVMRLDLLTQQWNLLRYSWPDAYHVALWTATTQLGSITEPLGPIAIDADGSLISTVDVNPLTLKPRMLAAAPTWYPSSEATKVRVVRSRDQGRTWSDTGIVINAPAGKTLWGCGWEHRSGGAAAIPWHLLCVISTGKGPEVGDWNGASVRFGNARAPATFGQVPVFWKR